MKYSKLWLLWLIIIVVLGTYFIYVLLASEDKTVFMPGELTSGHHQIANNCNACHVDSFSDKEAIQKKCVECHGEQRKKPFDSHPRAKFTDPRNADLLSNIDALYCVTCHTEHKPEITQSTGLSQPVDFCVHCHRDVGKDRPSHEGMVFDTCASSGCHNFHNNRSLYTDFLVKHIGEAELLEKRIVPAKEFSKVLDEIATYPHDRYPVKKLTRKDADYPDTLQITEEIEHDWVSTKHANSGVNCSSCHMKTENNKQAVWVNKPDHQACLKCHESEVKHFMQGKHGMRLKSGLSPMTPAMARLPMKPKSMNSELGCNSCHKAHKYDLMNATVDVCLDCHDDKHSVNYTQSSHYQLLLKEKSGDLPEGSGVSCATCHMPRVQVDVSDWLRRVVVQHNQNSTLVPAEKMIRPVCMSCHGLEFSIDSLADEKLIKNNFIGKPSIHIESMDMADKDNKRHLEETGGESF